MLGMHISLAWGLFMFFEGLVHQFLYYFLPLRQWEEESVQGKVVVVTGAASGIGRHVAKSMAKRGAMVVMAVRNLAEGSIVKSKIEEEIGCNPKSLSLVELDLGNLASVRRCAATIAKAHPTIDILVNNAGISQNSSKLSYTVDGFEQHMGVNHLGHFLLTQLLLPQLGKCGSPRVVTVTSTGLTQANLSVNDFMCESSYRGFLYTMHYCNSKLANALFSKELAKREYGRVKSYAVCPGFVKDTRLLRNYGGRRLAEKVMSVIGLSLDKGSDMILYAALSKEASSKSGQLFRLGRRCLSLERLLEERLAKDVWEMSERLVGLKSG